MAIVTESINLHWQRFAETISSSFQNLRNSSDLVDVTLACSSESERPSLIKAHKVVLAASSPLLRHLMVNMDGNSNGILYLSGIEERHVRSVLDFAYSGQVNVERAQLERFLQVAGELKVEGLITDLAKNRLFHTDDNEFVDESIDANQGQERKRTQTRKYSPGKAKKAKVVKDGEKTLFANKTMKTEFVEMSEVEETVVQDELTDEDRDIFGDVPANEDVVQDQQPKQDVANAANNNNNSNNIPINSNNGNLTKGKLSFFGFVSHLLHG